MMRARCRRGAKPLSRHCPLSCPRRDPGGARCPHAPRPSRNQPLLQHEPSPRRPSLNSEPHAPSLRSPSSAHLNSRRPNSLIRKRRPRRSQLKRRSRRTCALHDARGHATWRCHCQRPLRSLHPHATSRQTTWACQLPHSYSRRSTSRCPLMHSSPPPLLRLTEPVPPARVGSLLARRPSHPRAKTSIFREATAPRICRPEPSPPCSKMAPGSRAAMSPSARRSISASQSRAVTWSARAFLRAPPTLR